MDTSPQKHSLSNKRNIKKQIGKEDSFDKLKITE